MQTSIAPRTLTAGEVAAEYNESQMYSLFIRISADPHPLVRALYQAKNEDFLAERGDTVDIAKNGLVSVTGYAADAARTKKALERLLINSSGVEIAIVDDKHISVSERMPCGVTTRVVLTIFDSDSAELAAAYEKLQAQKDSLVLPKFHEGRL
jgi:hypothetical protein